MAVFLFASTPVPAHTRNATPFAARLVDAGHDVLWYAGRVFHRHIAAVGATPLAFGEAEDFGGVDVAARWPSFAGLDSLAAIRSAFTEVFVGQAAARVRDLRAIIAEHPVDAMLADSLMYGVGMTSELEGIPWASFGDGPLAFPEPQTPPFGSGLPPMGGPFGWLRNRVVSLAVRQVMFAAAQRRYQQARRDVGLPRTRRSIVDLNVSEHLHLHGATAGFEYPRHALPPQVHWVGPLRPDPPHAWTPPPWWPQVTQSARPVVLVSQGTIRADVSELILPTLRALADVDVTVVVTTGSADPDTLRRACGGALPANALADRFVPYDLLLPHVDAFVTNGGYTGVTLALSHGVPLVQAGTTEEKADVGARIAWAGVGVRLKTTRPRPAQVRAAVLSVLGDSPCRAAAGRLAVEMAPHDAGREGAALLARLALTRRPVWREPAVSRPRG